MHNGYGEGFAVLHRRITGDLHCLCLCLECLMGARTIIAKDRERLTKSSSFRLFGGALGLIYRFGCKSPFRLMTDGADDSSAGRNM